MNFIRKVIMKAQLLNIISSDSFKNVKEVKISEINYGEDMVDMLLKVAKL